VAIAQNGATSQPGITLTAKPKGTGLTIWRDILAQHGGQLSLTSKPACAARLRPSCWSPPLATERLAA